MTELALDPVLIFQSTLGSLGQEARFVNLHWGKGTGDIHLFVAPKESARLLHIHRSSQGEAISIDETTLEEWYKVRQLPKSAEQGVDWYLRELKPKPRYTLHPGLHQP